MAVNSLATVFEYTLINLANVMAGDALVTNIPIASTASNRGE